MHAPTGNAAPPRSVLNRLLVRSWGYRYPRGWAGVRFAVGICLVFVGGLLLADGYLWATLLLMVAAVLLDPEVAPVLAGVGIAVCVGAVVAVWVAGALYNALHSLHNAAHAPRARTRSQPGSTALIVVAVVCAGLAVVSRSHFDGLAVGALWVRVLGLAVLVASTVFTLWARFSLGTSWSVAPRVQGDHQLRTHGPYAVTRHPIYTGVLGMLLGATLLSGIGQWIVLFPVGLILFEVKIRMEEHLMLATFPDKYLQYRQQVPQLVPGFFALRQRHSANSHP